MKMICQKKPLQVEVIDFGIGIPESILKIFLIHLLQNKMEKAWVITFQTQ